MSSDRANNRPFKPTLASSRTARSPLAPRVAVKANSTPNLTPNTPRAPARASVVSAKLKVAEETPAKDVVSNGNVTPRSAARKSRVESSQNSPSQDEQSNATWPRSSVGLPNVPSERASVGSGVGMGSGRSKIGKSLSVVGDETTMTTNLHIYNRPLGSNDNVRSEPSDSFEGRFFHASDAPKQEPAPKRPEPKKAPSFFYADGRTDESSMPKSSRSPPPVIMAVSESRPSVPWMRSDVASNVPKAAPMLSPQLSSLTSAAPLFSPSVSSQQANQLRPLSPSKENIHLSYRKGASQIFGMRPTARTIPVQSSQSANFTTIDGQRRPSLSPPHHKSPSLSSIDSGNSHQSRRRSATAVDNLPLTSPVQDIRAASTSPRMISSQMTLPSIDTSLATSNGPLSPSEVALSPTKPGPLDVAADARRERKVLDLEISNSSLMAINTSLEREVRRQRAELKRYRRLSRAGHFSIVSNDTVNRMSDGLNTLDEEEVEDMYDDFGRPSGFSDFRDESSDSDDEMSLASGGESVTSDARSRQQDRLARDEKRLRLDLDRHREMLVQSQSMNQSLKRCMYATEAMIKDGRKALEYHVRVSDVKLGGRVLTGQEDVDEEAGDQIEAEDDTLDDTEGGMESARRLLDVWKGVGRPTFEGSEGSGDRDSGIEVDKLYARAGLGPNSLVMSILEDSGRPPESGQAQVPSSTATSST